MNTRPVIAGIGEILWDVYPDAAHFGGAPANFACHAAGLGADACMVGAVGVDTAGDDALRILDERGVDCSTVARDARHPTGSVLVRLDAHGQPSYEFASNTAWDHLQWSDDVGALAGRCDAVCFGTLAQRSPESRDTVRRFIDAVPAHAIRMFDVNLRQQFHNTETINASLGLATAVKLNAEELPSIAAVCGIGAANEKEMLMAVMKRFDVRLAALTRGARGALLIAGETSDECPAPDTIAEDTVGAGDAFTAALIVGLLQGGSLAEINRHANAVASYVCSQHGATPALPRHLRRIS